MTGPPRPFFQLGEGAAEDVCRPQWRPLIGSADLANARIAWLELKFGSILASRRA